MKNPGSFYCGVASLLYARETCRSLGVASLKVLAVRDGFEEFSSGDSDTATLKEKCFAELYEVFGISMGGYINHHARACGNFLRGEDGEQTWFCYFETPIASCPSLCVAILATKTLGQGQRGWEWVDDGCFLEIFSTPPAYKEGYHEAYAVLAP